MNDFIAARLHPISVDISAKNVTKLQPSKLASTESLLKTSKSGTLVVGDIPEVQNEEVRYGIHISVFYAVFFK